VLTDFSEENIASVFRAKEQDEKPALKQVESS
jgi:hypothetical protein